MAEFYLTPFRWGRRTDLKFERLGTRYGGWRLPVDALSPGTVAVSAGAGEDISFDLELIRRYHMTVHIVDPTPRARSHVLAVMQAVEGRAPITIDRGRDPRVTYDLAGVDRGKIKYWNYGLWHRNEMVRFYVPANPDNVSHSAVNLQRTSEYFEAECLQFRTICAQGAIDAVEILKLDIEGAEHDVIQDVIAGDLRPRIICVEFDEAQNRPEPATFKRVRSNVKGLNAAGYDLCCIDGWNFTFIQRIPVLPE